MQNRDRFPAQALGYDLDYPGSERDHRSPLFLYQREIRRLLGGTGGLIATSMSHTQWNTSNINFLTCFRKFLLSADLTNSTLVFDDFYPPTQRFEAACELDRGRECPNCGSRAQIRSAPQGWARDRSITVALCHP